MKFRVVSKDENVRRTCRDLVREIFPQADIFGAPESTGHENPDFYILDYVPSSNPIPQTFLNARFGGIFLVHRDDLVAFLKDCPGGGWVVLKPLDRWNLTTNLEQVSRLAADGKSSVHSDRNLLLECLLRANLDLQQQQQDRANFIMRAAHELRSPLTTFAGYCALLGDGKLGNLSAQQGEVLQRMRKSAKRLEQIANSLFEISMHRDPEGKISLTDCEFEECLQQAIHEMQPSLNSKEITLSVSCQPSLGLLIDRSKVEQLLVNLLDNACRFTPAHGRITVRGYLTSPHETGLPSADTIYRCDVTNSGPTIEPEAIEKVFQPFFSEGPGDGRLHHGLGLSICQKIVASHSGQIWAKNNVDGVCFSFVLPLARTGKATSSVRWEAKSISLGA